MKRWYCLRGEEVTDSVVVPETCDIADLKVAIHNKCSKTLGHLDARVLEIRLSKTASEALEPDALVSGISGSKCAKDALYVDYPDESAAKRPRTGGSEEVQRIESILRARQDGDWLIVGSDCLIYIRKCYTKMAELLMNSMSSGSIDRLTYVVKGTPGIGKSTMLNYLLWHFTQHDTPFTVVLFATAQGACVFRKSGNSWKSEAFDGKSSVHVDEGGKSIGLVDVNPTGEVDVKNRTVMKLNQQGPCRCYGLHRLVVAASAGASLRQLIGKDWDGAVPVELWLPAWQSEHTRLWAQRVLDSTDDASLDRMESVCGLGVPRLVKMYSKDENAFKQQLSHFIASLSHRNIADRETTAKDAHTMLLLQPSEVLCETEVDAGHCPGDVVGFVSRAVDNEVKRLVCSGHSFTEVVRSVPRVVVHLFEHMVVRELVTTPGLRTVGDGGERDRLTFCGQGTLLQTMQGMKTGVLYSPPLGVDYPSIDLCGVPCESTTFYLMQCTTAQRHNRVQNNHVNFISVPRAAKQTVILYIVPTSSWSITLEDGKDPLPDGKWKRKPVSTKVVSVPTVLARLPEDVQMRFEPGQHR